MATTPDLPPGYELVRPDVGAGKTSRVSLIRRSADGELFAFKVRSGGKADSRADAAALVERSKEWVRLDLAPGPTVFAPDGRSLLQPWVEGESLRDLLRRTPLLGDPADPRLPALAGLFRRIVLAPAYVSGLNSGNLIFDGERFFVIDSGAVRRMASAHGAWRRQREKLARHWIRFDGHSSGAIGTLLDRMEERLELPRPTLLDRIRYRLLRR